MEIQAEPVNNWPGNRPVGACIINGRLVFTNPNHVSYHTWDRKLSGKIIAVFAGALAAGTTMVGISTIHMVSENIRDVAASTLSSDVSAIFFVGTTIGATAALARIVADHRDPSFGLKKLVDLTIGLATTISVMVLRCNILPKVADVWRNSFMCAALSGRVILVLVPIAAIGSYVARTTLDVLRRL